MRYSQVPVTFQHLLALLFASAGITTSTFGQSTEPDLVYKFSVQGIEDPAAAKLLQYALMEQPVVTFCNFIDECDCFKLGANTPLDHVTLESLLHDQGHLLVGEVVASDGTVLKPSLHSPEQK